MTSAIGLRASFTRAGMSRSAMLLALPFCLAGAPARADAPLAGSYLVALSPGVAFCSSPRELAAFTLAKIQHDYFPANAFPGCVTVTQGTPVQVTQDLGPSGTPMHVVKAHAALSFPFRAIDAYTYSVGLYRQYYSPFIEGLKPLPFP